MSSILRPTTMTLNDRLAVLGRTQVRLEAVDFASEAGEIQRVGKRFTRVNQQYFVPAAMNQIVLVGPIPQVKTSAVFVRTTFRGAFEARLIRTGKDFVELIAGEPGGEERLLIPLNKVISVEGR
ncbi:hypothetical protein [Paenibacillus sp. y28]|uniref:hypothetical protein n=1 Tax=Paenibacillus sp. y28 TaxID=3129110 RepID=UPI0030176BB9